MKKVITTDRTRIYNLNGGTLREYVIEHAKLVLVSSTNIFSEIRAIFPSVTYRSINN